MTKLKDTVVDAELTDDDPTEADEDRRLRALEVYQEARTGLDELSDIASSLEEQDGDTAERLELAETTIKVQHGMILELAKVIAGSAPLEFGVDRNGDEVPIVAKVFTGSDVPWKSVQYSGSVLNELRDGEIVPGDIAAIQATLSYMAAELASTMDTVEVLEAGPNEGLIEGLIDVLVGNFPGDPIVHMANGDFVPCTTEELAFALRAISQSIGADGIGDRISALEARS